LIELTEDKLMVMQLSRRHTQEKLLVERIMYTKRYTLVLDKEKCVGCEICRIACPREAITVVKSVKNEGKNLSKSTVNLDETKCSFCGICTAICPFGALTLTMNGNKWVPVLEKEAFPQVIHEVTVDESKCPVDCTKCEESCPFKLIKVTSDKALGRVHVQVDKEHCPGCQLCEVKCPKGAIVTRKIFSGSMAINKEKCPENCHDCVDVCPITDVLRFLEDNKVEVNEKHCVYCGACKAVCPVENALFLQRYSVYHTPIHSGAWNKALEKIATVNEVTKELRSKSSIKVRETIKKRFS
jgi:4Fe-4S ferredoxin